MRIIHPQPLAGRQTQFDVEFIDGVATVESLHPERELAFIQHGFTIEPDPEVESPHQVALGEPILDLTALTKKQLQAIADDEGVDIPSRATHAEMVDILSRRPAHPIPGSVDNGDGSFTAPAVDGPFATFELPDGTVLGDGTSIVTLNAEDDSEG